MWCITKHDSMSHNVLVTGHYVFTYPRRWASTLNIMSVMSDIRCFNPISEKFLCLTKVFLVRYWRNPISRIFIMLVWMLLFESIFMLKRENGYGNEHDNWHGHKHGQLTRTRGHNKNLGAGYHWKVLSHFRPIGFAVFSPITEVPLSGSVQYNVKTAIISSPFPYRFFRWLGKHSQNSKGMVTRISRAVLRSRNYLFRLRLRLSKSFRSRLRLWLTVSFVSICFHSF